MQPELWSLNRLATELHRDRRFLAKLLGGIKPAETKKRGNGMNRFYRLADVVNRLVDIAAATAETVEGGAELDIHEARRRKTVAEMRLAEISVEQQLDRLIDIETHGEVWQRMIGNCRQHMLGLPHRLATKIGIGAEQQKRIFGLAQEIVYASLDELSESEIDIDDLFGQDGDETPDDAA